MTEREQDQALLERVRAGDMSACDDCIRIHAPGIYRLALRLMRNEAEAEDVMQDTFLNAFKGIMKFDGRASLRTWLYRIAYNAAMMRLRKRQPEMISLDEIGDGQDITTKPQSYIDWTSLPQQELEKIQVREEVDRAIQELPSKLYAVFVMRELEELSTEETARALELSEQAVKTRLHRARLWLRERLTDYFAPHVTAVKNGTV
jgi:RNA polymerase sigma-70 factor (ECF subfamily)